VGKIFERAGIKTERDSEEKGKIAAMPKRSSKRDDFQNALRVVEKAIGGTLKKNPAAVALGRRGGLKGGKARAESMTPQRRKEIAQQAAKTRWAKKRKQ
jgi:hypothetical protein